VKLGHFLQSHFATKCCMRVHTGYLRSNSLGPETIDSKTSQFKTENKYEAKSKIK
jgi:hypothetical protein